MVTVHNYEQLMAWRLSDLQSLLGAVVHIDEASDIRAFIADPHGYTGDWKPISTGTVQAARMDEQHCEPEWFELRFEHGGGVMVQPGQPLRLIEEA